LRSILLGLRRGRPPPARRRPRFLPGRSPPGSLPPMGWPGLRPRAREESPPMFQLIANVLAWFYDLVPNYAAAIALLTLAIMILLTPLTLKSTKSMLELQRLQPEVRRLQQQYKGDRQRLNEEMMALYKEHRINPLGGC